MARHELAYLLPVAAEKNQHLYKVLARHILSVQGQDIIADLSRVKELTGDVKHFDLFRVCAKYHIPPWTLLTWLEHQGALKAGTYKGILERIGFVGLHDALIRCATEPGLLPHDGQTIGLIEHGLSLSEIERGFEFFWRIDQRQKPQFRGQKNRDVKMLSTPYIHRISGKGLYTYNRNNGYMTQPDWARVFFRLYPVAHAVWCLGGLNAQA